jgi:hypothetical protein
MQRHEYPFDRVWISCEKCERRGIHLTGGLAEWFGTGSELPDEPKESAGDCPGQGLQSVAMDPCGALVPDLRGGIPHHPPDLSL